MDKVRVGAGVSKTLCLLSTLCLSVGTLFAQEATSVATDREYYSPPMIGGFSSVITPDARSAALGGLGVATSADPHSIAHNMSKVVVNPKTWGLSFSYTPWMTDVAKDMGISYLSGYYTWGEAMRHGVSASFRYFDIGEALMFPKQAQAMPLTINPFELSVDLGYALSLSPKWSLGAAVRYLRSDLNAETISGEKDSPRSIRHIAQNVSLDLSATYTTVLQVSEYALGLQVGGVLNNIGGKISYDGGKTVLFSPTVLRIGGQLAYDFSDLHSLSVGVEIEKFLAPTMPIPTDADYIHRRQALREMSPFKAMLSSFGDASGGWSEELREVSVASGVEYVYDRTFFARLGGRYQHPTKGNNSGISLGVGAMFSKFTLDVSYFIGVTPHNPLNNTMRFSLGFSL